MQLTLYTNMGCQSSRTNTISKASGRTGDETHLAASTNGHVLRSASNFNCLSLDDIQIDCIRSTWPLVAKDKVAHGSAIFREIFESEECLKSFFKFQ